MAMSSFTTIPWSQAFSRVREAVCRTVHLLSAETNALKLQTATRSEVSPVWLVKPNLEPFCQRHAAPHMVHELYATGRPWGIPASEADRAQLSESELGDKLRPTSTITA